MTERSEQHHNITLPLVRLRWLQEMGVPPALLRPYAPHKSGAEGAAPVMEQGSKQVESQSASGSGRALFQQMLQAMGASSASARAAQPLVKKEAERVPAPPPPSITAHGAPGQVVQDVPKEAAPEVSHSTFAQWQQNLQACRACPRCEERTEVLIGIGVQHSPDWFVLGGVPTRQDEAAGRIWSASSGRLLAAQLRSIGLNVRQQVYLSYALKCRSNHPQPSAESLAACREVFLHELYWVQPKALLVLGAAAAHMLWGEEARFNERRGQLQQWTDPQGRDWPVVVTVDPTDLLLRPQQKARAWRDLLVVRQWMSSPR